MASPKVDDLFVGQVIVIVERGFKNEEAAQQWIASMESLLKERNALALQHKNLNVESHLWVTT